MSRIWAEVIGDPIVQSKSPAIHGAWATALGIAADYRRAHVKPADLADYLTLRRADADWRGCNVTMPHKQAIIPLLDRLDDLAARIGAVNTVVREADGRLIGYNTDAPGFAEPLGWTDGRLAGGRVLVLGAGGAARAIVVALAEAGCDITLAARDIAKAQALLDELAPDRPGLAAPLARFAQAGHGSYGLVVNASPLGMVGNPPLSFDLSHLRDGGTVYDIVTAPLVTPLLAGAGVRGLRVIDGLAMLIGQADYAFGHFFGQRPDRSDGDAALRKVLAA